MRFVIWSVFSAFLLTFAPVHAEISGKARVIEGDILALAGQRIRLHGIDAPESGQLCEADRKPWLCGKEAILALIKLIGRKEVACNERSKDRYGRIVAVCRIEGPKGKDLNRAMVAEGWALAYRLYSIDYVTDEAAAKADRKGLWRGRFIKPWEWRHGKRLPLETANSSGACLIKGNINQLGKRIYFIPHSSFYNSVKIDKEVGERWFCSEHDARAAGWQKSKW